MAATLQNIFRYPVKSMGGQALEGAALGSKGIPGDRAWAVKDEQGSIRNGKRSAELMSCTTRLLSEPSPENPSPLVEICAPDGTAVTTDSDQVNAVLSNVVGNSVSLWPLMPEDQLEHYRRHPPEPGSDQEAAFREVFARTPDEPLPDLSAFPAELFQYESPPGTYFDAYPLLLLSSNALAAIREGASDSLIDVRRFRPNLLFDAGSEPGYPERDWCGKTVRLGTVTLQIELECPRCIMTTHGFADLPRDPTIMRTLVKENGGNLGVYATVLEPGTVTVGDVLEIA
ncbi:MAG: MOSC domain-containing protein [Gammaproteobacteria bacterium]|nr:MOSC domain-containing protein [Gammaproteobacteria bacterium]